MQGSPILGQCKLCLRHKQLHESHLIPKALYTPGKKGIQYATRSQSGVNPEHMQDTCSASIASSDSTNLENGKSCDGWLPKRAGFELLFGGGLMDQR